MSSNSLFQDRMKFQTIEQALRSAEKCEIRPGFRESSSNTYELVEKPYGKISKWYNEMLRLGFHARVKEQSVTGKPTNPKIKVGAQLRLNRLNFERNFLMLMDVMEIYTQ